MMNPLDELKQLARSCGATDIASIVLNDPRFAIWSGSSKPEQHHYGKGGLVKHTAEVTRLCLNNNDTLYLGIRPANIVLAAIFHDSGKMWDYYPTDDTKENWESTQHKYEIHHISRSALLWHEVSQGYFYRDEVTHAILAHHGQREWGSPVSPRSKLAWLLHLCDQMSARMDDCLTFKRK